MEDKKWLNWDISYDDNDNTVWEAPGMWSEEDGSYYYRISQKLRGDKIRFVEDSDEELWLDFRSAYREEWNALEDAKYDMDRNYQEMMKNYDNAPRSLQ